MNAEQAVANIRKEADNLEEGFSGQREEYFHQEVIKLAVSRANEVISAAADGSRDNLDYLTSETMYGLMEHLGGSFRARRAAQEMARRNGEQT